MSIAEQLAEMGVDSAKAEEAAKNCTTLEDAKDWLVSRQESEMETDSAAPSTDADAAACFKCNDCGKVMKDEDAMTLHISETSHENFEESTQSIKPLTEEEKKQQAALLKQKIKEPVEKKAEKEEKEKFDNVRVQVGRILAALPPMEEETAKTRTPKQTGLDQIKAGREARKAAASELPLPTPTPAIPDETKEATTKDPLPTGEVLHNIIDVRVTLSED